MGFVPNRWQKLQGRRSACSPVCPRVAKAMVAASGWSAEAHDATRCCDDLGVCRGGSCSTLGPGGDDHGSLKVEITGVEEFRRERV